MLRLFAEKVKIARRCCSHATVSLKNSLIFIIKPTFPGSGSNTEETPQAAHYKTHTIFPKVMFQLEHRAEILIQNKKQNKQKQTEKSKNSKSETQTKCFFQA